MRNQAMTGNDVICAHESARKGEGQRERGREGERERLEEVPKEGK